MMNKITGVKVFSVYKPLKKNPICMVAVSVILTNVLITETNKQQI